MQDGSLSLVHGIPLAEEPGQGAHTIGGYLREVVARYGFDDSDLNIAVSFDDGTTWEQERQLSAAGYGSPKWDREQFDNPTNAQHAKIRISFVNPDVTGIARVMALRLQSVAPFNTW